MNLMSVSSAVCLSLAFHVQTESDTALSELNKLSVQHRTGAQNKQLLKKIQHNNPLAGEAIYLHCAYATYSMCAVHLVYLFACIVVDWH